MKSRKYCLFSHNDAKSILERQCYYDKKYINFYLSIYRSKGASCNVAGDGPETQWDIFVKSGIVLSTDNEHVYFGMYNIGGGDCFYHSILQLRDLSSIGIVTISDLRFGLWYFAVNHQKELCREIYEAFRALQDNESYEEFIVNIRRPQEWACSRIIVIMSIYLQTDIIIITNELNIVDGSAVPGIFDTRTVMNDQRIIRSDLVLHNDNYRKNRPRVTRLKAVTILSLIYMSHIVQIVYKALQPIPLLTYRPMEASYHGIG